MFRVIWKNLENDSLKQDEDCPIVRKNNPHFRALMIPSLARKAAEDPATVCYSLMARWIA